MAPAESQGKAHPGAPAVRADLAQAREVEDSVEAGEREAEGDGDEVRKAGHKGLQLFGARNASSASESTGFITASTTRMEILGSTPGLIRSTRSRHPKSQAGRTLRG